MSLKKLKATSSDLTEKVRFFILLYDVYRRFAPVWPAGPVPVGGDELEALVGAQASR